MKVVAIEIAEVVERDIAKFLEENEKAGAMRFTRFVDLGGKQIELYLYPPQQGASVWCTIGIKSVFRTDQGECIVYSVKLPESERSFEDTLVNPTKPKLPALSERVLEFLKDELLQKASEEGAALEGGSGLALESSENSGPAAEAALESGSASDSEAQDSSDAESTVAEESPLSEISEDSEEDAAEETDPKKSD